MATSLTGRVRESTQRVPDQWQRPFPGQRRNCLLIAALGRPGEHAAMVIPSPRERLANCIWLPRIIAKGRLLRAGKLAPEFVARFGVANGVDNVFLTHFELTKEEVIAASAGTDDEVAAWFLGLPQATPERILEWNHIAVNLGKAGFSLETRLPIGLATTYAHVAHLKPETIFAMLEADEGLPPG
jgi:hypothetical protein